MTRTRLSLVSLLFAAVLATTACSVPGRLGGGGYYEITDRSSGQVWYARAVEREKRGVVEFRDGATGAWVSVAEPEVREISRGEYRQHISQ